MRDVLDIHTHTVASGHAYSTIRENAHMAAKKGLKLLGITEHAPHMVGTCHDFYFQNLKVVDRSAYDVPVLLGAELNILDTQGHVDLRPSVLKTLDVVIASLHTPCIKPGTREENTQAILMAMQNPYVNIIGHPDDPRYPLDYPAVVQAAREYGVLLELNNSSLRPDGSRKNAGDLVKELMKQCMRYQAPVIISSDAHVDTDVGNHKLILELLEEVDFPEELVINADPERLKPYINLYKDR
ncbi:MAG: phosphatase [Lachnospiraceae bacterium]|nr:phosphatase [Lachnospiraceae bacterium]